MTTLANNESANVTDKKKDKFRLLQLFSIISLSSALVVTVLIGAFFEHLSLTNLIQLGKDKHTPIAQVFATQYWPSFSKKIDQLTNLNIKELRMHPDILQLAQAIRIYDTNSHQLNVSIYNQQGYAVFSTDPGLIGHTLKSSAQFIRVQKGEVVSKLNASGVLSNIEHNVSSSNSLSTLFPLPEPNNNKVQAVLVLTSNVNHALSQIENSQGKLYFGIAGILLVFIGILFLILKHANDVIKKNIRSLASQKKQIEHQAYHDPLTGLANRQLFRFQLSHAVTAANRNQCLIAVLSIDLDHFKNINDSLGHQMGDDVLLIIAGRLKQCLRESDTIARIGGDEFIICLDSIFHIDIATEVAQRILRKLADPVLVDKQELFITPSIGITIYPFDENNGIDGIIKNADIAMYRAKEAGRNTFRFYTSKMNNRANERLSLESKLRKALDRNEFELHYQPLISLRDGNVYGVEALLRWRNPQGDIIAPGEFIPLLEETGLILPVGNWVLETACQQASGWQQQGFPTLMMHVNLSAKQFTQHDLIHCIRNACENANYDSDYLDLEITESSLIKNLDEAIRTVTEINQMGVKLSIDDFGTGYSSLSYLKRIPIQTIKIDRSFVRDITTDPDDAAIVEAISALSRSLRLQVVAEGVENGEQLNFLKNKGVDLVQGFFFSRPLSAAKLEEQYLKNYPIDSYQKIPPIHKLSD